MSKVKEKKLDEYDYPEIRAIGDKIKGSTGFITHVMLNDKYTTSYVRRVMRGKRRNNEIEAVMKQLAEMSNENNH